MTFIVCGAVGLDTSGSSAPYVAGWGESGELDAIRGYAETIDKIAAHRRRPRTRIARPHITQSRAGTGAQVGTSRP